MEGEQNDMKEIKVMVFSGNLAELAKSEMKDVVLKNRFQQQQGYTVQQFSYACKKQRDETGTTFGVSSGVVVDFTIRVMTNDQTLFYDKLKDLGADHYSFVFNGTFENGQSGTHARQVAGSSAELHPPRRQRAKYQHQ